MRRIFVFLILVLLLLPALPASAAPANALSSFGLTTATVEVGQSVSFQLKMSKAGRLYVRIVDPETDKVVRTVLSAGLTRGTVKGKFDAASLVVGKPYLLRAELKSAGARLGLRELSFTPLPVAPRITKGELSCDTFFPDTGALKLQLTLKTPGALTAGVYDASGALLAALAEGASVPAGKQTLRWDGKDALGAYYPSGRYAVRAFYTDAEGVTTPAVALGFAYDAPPAPQPECATLWERLTSPITVSKAHYLTEVSVTSRPGGGSRAGYTFGTSAGMRVLGTQGKYTHVEIAPYKGRKETVRGYILTSKLKTLAPTSPYGVYVNRASQTMHVYRNGAEIFQCEVSTGQPGFRTPSGEYIIPNRKTRFTSGAYVAKYAVRFVGRMYFHEIPTINGSYGRTQRELGTPASHGCIRLPRGTAKWFYDTIPDGTKVIIE